MAITPAVVVNAPEPRGLRYGIYSAANGPFDLPPHGAAGGVTYDPVSCGEAHTYPATCRESRDDQRESKTFDGNDAWPTASPFIGYASVRCGSSGTNPDQLRTKALRRLSNGEQTIVEAGMATVLGAGATPIVGSDPSSIVAIVADLEQWLYGVATANYGNVGYLHAPVRVAAYAQSEDLLVPDGAVLRTRMGTVWIFGGGYPDDGTISISGQPTVWRSPDVFVTPPEQALNLSTNEYRVFAEREFAVTYECTAASTVWDWTIPS